MAAMLALGKAFFLLSLLVTHLVLFGVPALQRFLEAGVTVVESVEQADSLPAPAVTVCPSEKYFSAWKNTTSYMFGNTYEVMCGGAASGQDFMDCVKEKTFNFTETFPSGSHLGLPGAVIEDLSSPDFWISDTTVAVLGRCFTLNFTRQLKAEVEEDSLMFNLNKDLDYNWFIHTLDFFMITWNPLTLPTIQGELEYGKQLDSHRYLYLRAVRQERLNRAEQPCNPDPGYSFSSCIKSSVSAKVGCRQPWDSHATGTPCPPSAIVSLL